MAVARIRRCTDRTRRAAVQFSRELDRGSPAVTAESEMHFFDSPSGNIACLPASDWVRCDIRERSWAPPPRPADCPSQTGYGQVINLEAFGQATFVCAGDTTFGGDASTLQYGSRAATTGYACASETSGIKCENRDGHGFTIGRDSYDLF